MNFTNEYVCEYGTVVVKKIETIRIKKKKEDI